MSVSKDSSKRLESLIWTAESFGLGLMRKGPGGFESVNSTMERFKEIAGELEVFDGGASVGKPLEVKATSGEIGYFVVKRYEIDEEDAMVVVQEVTAEKSSEQALQEVMQSLEHAKTEKTDFLSHVGHELRSPLNSIIVLSDMFSKKGKETLSERQIKSAEMINRSGNQLLRLIDDIMDLAKVESGRISAEVTDTNIRSVMENCLSDLKFISDSKKINLALVISDDVPEKIQTDPARLSQVIRILMENGVKFTRQGSVSIQVSLLDSNTVQFNVSDTGKGIAAEDLQRLAEEFQQDDIQPHKIQPHKIQQHKVQQHKVQRGESCGAGLGLNVVRNMVGLLRGKIHLKSELQQGSCFSVNLPIHWDGVAEADSLIGAHTSLETQQSTEARNHKADSKIEKAFDQDTELTSVSASQSSASKTQRLEIEKPDGGVVEKCLDLKSKTVMLVESDIRQVFTLMAALEPFDFDVIVAQSGRDALDKLQEQKALDIVIMDSQLPNMDGSETIEEIRRQGRWNDLPVIAVLDDENAVEEDRCRVAGATDCLTKPIDINLLVQKMSAAIRTDQRN